MTAKPSSGQVITFYSYKGGTGRSMALANVACLLAQWSNPTPSKGILMVDWDLEAPGLDRFFRGQLTSHISDKIDTRALDEHTGLIDFFADLELATRDMSPIDEDDPDEAAEHLFERLGLRDRILKTDIPLLSLLKAGRFDDRYIDKVNTFPWEALFTRARWIFPALAKYLGDRFDYVLIDSRTGLSDMSGICTTLMPEKLVIVFTPNDQGLSGGLELGRRATTYRRTWDDLRPLSVFPLPSRIEPSEPELRNQWRYGDSEKGLVGYQHLFEQFFREAYDISKCDLESYFNEVQIQHVPRYAYGEEIAVLIERGGDRLSLTQSYKSFVDRLVGLRGPWEESTREIIASLDMAPDIEQATTVFARLEALIGADNPGLAPALIKLASLHAAKGSFTEAEAYYLRALQIQNQKFGRFGREVASLLIGLATVQRKLGKLTEAEQALRQALEIFVREDDQSAAAEVLVDIAGINIQSGNTSVARRNYQDALGLFRKAKDQPGEASALRALAALEAGRREYFVSRQFYNEASEILRNLNDRVGEANVLQSLAKLDARELNYDSARGLYLKALAILRESGDELQQGDTLRALAALDRRQFRFETARDMYYRALNAFRSGKDRVKEAQVLIDLGALAARVRDDDLAREYFLEALRIFQEKHSSSGEISAYRALGDLEKRRGELGAASSHYHEALALQQKRGSRAGEASMRTALGDLESRMGDVENARFHYHQARTLYVEIGNRLREAYIDRAEARIFSKEGRPTESAELIRHALNIYWQIGRDDLAARASRELKSLGKDEPASGSISG